MFSGRIGTSICWPIQLLQWQSPAVRKRRTVLVCVACVGLALVILALNNHAPEPVYGGHRLSFWVEGLGIRSPPSGDMEGATNAIDHIGAASLPFLLRWIQYEPAEWQRKLCVPLDRLQYGWAHRLSGWLLRPRNLKLAFGSCTALHVLGPRAIPALEDLRRLMNETKAPMAAQRATAAMGDLGTNGLPDLLAVIENPLHPQRLVAVAVLGQMPDVGDAADTAVPAIIACIGLTNAGYLPLVAVDTLGRLKTAPELAIPALVTALQSTNTTLRSMSAEALGRFGPKAISAIPALTNALADTAPDVKFQARRALHAIAPATFSARPWMPRIN